MKRVAGEYGYGRVEDLLAGIGGKLIPRNVIAKYLGPEQFEQLTNKRVAAPQRVRAVKHLSGSATIR